MQSALISTQNSTTVGANPELDHPQRLFQCSTCKRSFTRADHLTRHVRAHTKSKPYVCPVCAKGFARIDLLKRHVTNHDSESANKRQKREIARDTRVVQACEACSQSHLRCEDEKPCSRCRKKSIPCRVPDVSGTTDGSESNELDAVHAAQDLLDLSNGFDFPASTSIGMDDNSRSLTPKMVPSGTPVHFRHPSSTVLPHPTSNQAHHGDRPRQPSVSISHNMAGNGGDLASSNLQQPYQDDTASSLAFFNDAVSSFDATPNIDPFLPDYFRNISTFDNIFSGHATPRGIMDHSFDLDVGLTDLDLGLLDQYNFQIPFAAGTPSTDTQGLDNHLPETDGAPVRTEAFKQSIWRYLPQRNRDFSGAAQADLAIADLEKDSERRAHLMHRRAITEKLHRVSRDRLMALVLSTCSPEHVMRISSAFPSNELLDGLIQYFLTAPSIDAVSWFHLPTFSLAKSSPVLLTCIVSAGAVMTPDTSLRKLGFALHEAARTSQSKSFEEDNTSIRDMQNLRTHLLQLQTGMWSGISRKMEIAESFFQPHVTMLRRGGRFRRTTWKEISPSADDQGQALEQKWHDWAQQESDLRVIHRTFELDMQSSMALLKPPLVSYTEMQLPLPSPNVLWQAQTAAAWKAAYLNDAQAISERPSPIESFLDLDHLARYDSAANSFLHMAWGMVWEYRQMVALTMRPNIKTNNSLILSSRYQELTKQLEDFRVNNPSLSKSTEIALELMLLHLNAPLDEVQLFAGIEGQEEARNAYPALRDWVKTVPARQALWHAGQILRAAEQLPRVLLCNFNAIATYHAGLILWGYGFLKRTSSHGQRPSENVQNTIILNGEDGLDIRRFATLDRGIPSIKSPRSQVTTELTDVPGVMDVLVQLLRVPHKSKEGLSPPLVGNLVQLLEGLRSASASK